MAKIRIDLSETLLDGKEIKFKAPCSCSEVTGLTVFYPAEDETTRSKDLVFRDAHGNDLTGIGNLFSKDAYVKVIVDTVNGYAYLQNADNNSYLNSAIFGTYTHDAENLIGMGDNGKFKATASGTISTIKVNGVDYSVRCGEDTTMDVVAGCWYTFILDGNTVNFNSGGAGAGLNFKMVGGTTQPVSPRENLIWVNTDTAISSYVFAAVEPSTPSEGMVWVLTGDSSNLEFNALKKNALQVYPLSVRQYQNGVWVKVAAQSYRSGNWIDWIVYTYLYNTGDECTDVSGGWAATGKKANSSSNTDAATPTVTRNADNILAKLNTDERSGIFYAKTSIDLTKCSRLVAEGEFYLNSESASANNLALCIWSSLGTYYQTNLVSRTGVGEKATVVTRMEADISAIEGKHIIGFLINTTNDAGGSYVKLNKCWLES